MRSKDRSKLVGILVLQNSLQDDVFIDFVWGVEECVQSENVHNGHFYISATLQGIVSCKP